MDLNIDYNTIKFSSLGYSIHNVLKNKRDGILEIIFTKGKYEMEVEQIMRINIYESSIVIILKDNTQHFINLLNVTQIS